MIYNKICIYCICAMYTRKAKQDGCIGEGGLRV